MALSLPCSSSSLSSLLLLLTTGQANLSSHQEQDVKEVASILGITINLEKEQDVQEHLEVKQEEQGEVEVANMAVFSARSREPTLNCLPEQTRKMVPKRGKSGRYYPPNWLTCEFCGKSFNRRINVRAHKHKRHPELVGDNEVCCKFCPKYYNKQAMIAHIRGKHPNEAKNLIPRMKIKKLEKIRTNTQTRYHCKLCNMYFITNYRLKLHLRIHMAEKPFVCNSCGCDFTQKVHYKRHVEKYHQETEQSDGKETISFEAKPLHIQGEKNNPNPFQCDFCHEVFKIRKDLKTHMHVCREKNFSTLVNIENLLVEYTENESVNK